MQEAMKHRAPLLVLALVLFLPALALAADIERPDLAALFTERGLDGCFVVLRGTDIIRVNPGRAATPFRPASTFKIVNSLVALNSGVAPDTTFFMKWDGVVREFPAWNHDLTLEQAFRASALWYFVKLGQMNGRERLADAMHALDYGNADATGSDQFWIDGGLRISADGQVRFLAPLARGEVPFSARSLRLLRQIMLTDHGSAPEGDWALYTKTGFAEHGGAGQDVPVGWIVGFAERDGKTYPFALNVSERPGERKSAPTKYIPERRELARTMLERLGILPSR
jgi:beta-lactamase class D